MSGAFKPAGPAGSQESLKQLVLFTLLIIEKIEDDIKIVDSHTLLTFGDLRRWLQEWRTNTEAELEKLK